MNHSEDVYIKTGASSGYIPTEFISSEEYEYIIIPNDQRFESSGEVRAIPRISEAVYNTGRRTLRDNDD